MKTFKRLQKLMLTLAVAGIFLLSNITPVAAVTKAEYFLSFLYSVDTKTFGSIVVTGTGRDSMENTYSELDSTDSLLFITNSNGSWTAPGEMKTGEYLTHYPYTFPEFTDTEGTQSDYAMASTVGTNLTKSLNSALAFILKPVTAAGRKDIGVDVHTGMWSLAATLSNAGYDVISNNNQTFKAFSFGEKLKWSMRQATADDMKTVKNIPQGLTNKDYVVIKNYDGDSLTVPYAIPKGYGEGQELYGQQSTAIPASTITQKLSWGHVVYLSVKQFSNGYTVQNNTEMKQQDKISKAIAEFLNGIISGIAGAIGLFDVEELMFNTGNRGATYYYGIMPMSWLNPVNVLNLIATVISLVVIGISIVRMLIKRNMAAISPSVRADMMEGVKDMFIVMMGIVMFMPALFILLNFNNVLVSAMRDMAPSGTTLGLTSGSDFIGIVAAIMSVAYIFIMIMLNITYITRAITLALLIGFAPFFISMFAAGPSSKKISATWLKELISNIFMQTFNAAMLLVFANIGSFGGLTVIEKFALLISFIPLTKFFKTSLMNLGSGSDAASEKAGGAFSTLAAGLAAGSLEATMDGKTPKGGKVGATSGVASKDAELTKMTSGMTDAKVEKESLMGRIGGVAKGTAEASKNFAKNPVESMKELGKSAAKFAPEAGKAALAAGANAAAMGAAAGVSLGSASTGGSLLVGNKAIYSGMKNIQNRAESLFGDDESDLGPKTIAQGNELAQDGISGFNEGATMFTGDTRYKINEDGGADFKQSIETYNQKPENADNPAEILYNDNQSAIVGVKIPGVGGKTVTRKDPDTNKIISSESAYVGKDRLDEFKADVLHKYVPKK